MDLCDINQIKLLLGRHGFRFSKSMGQNFLVENWVPERIAEEAELDEKTGVLEVGPGIGCLTEQLAKRAGRVTSVELDTALEPVLHETLGDYDNVRIIFGDVLKTDLAQLVENELPGLRPVVCANLPYNITSPVISEFIDTEKFETMTLMVQREVARRICARAGTSDYGAFTVYCGFHASCEILLDVSPECFIPQPKVWSSVIRLTRRENPPVHVEDEKLFFQVVRASFNQRRKTLQNGLSSGLSEFSKQEITEVIASCGLDERVRGEALGLEGFAAVANGLFALRHK